MKKQNSSSRRSKEMLRRIDTEIVKRIIIILHDDGRERKTKISLKAHLAYDKCLHYLGWLELMGLISIEKSVHGIEWINLTEKGIELYSKYSIN
ncbi:MAG: winged helix-turn-helix domain-containing protein [Nitrososphaerales archaeon]